MLCDWWNFNKNEFTLASHVFAMVYPISSTSSSSESAFSYAGNAKTDRRKSVMSPSLLSNIAFLKTNMSSLPSLDVAREYGEKRDRRTKKAKETAKVTSSPGESSSAPAP